MTFTHAVADGQNGLGSADGLHSDALTHTANGHHICARKEEKNPATKVIKQALEAKKLRNWKPIRVAS